MIFKEISSFIGTLQKGKRLLALDVSKNNIGIAVSDVDRILASPLAVIKRARLAADIETIKKYITENNAGGLVIGLPLNMDGSSGPRCQSVRQFGRDILKSLDIPIIFFDERLSTFAASEALKSSDFTKKKKAGLEDKVAASFILQEFLNHMAREK